MIDAADTAPRRWGETLLVAIALAASVALVWVITREPLVPLTYAGGLAVLGGLAALLGRGRRPAEADVAQVSDWSVTVAAIEGFETAVAITDRAQRLVCANQAYVSAFGPSYTPVALPLAPDQAEQLGKLGRAAWRDGAAGPIDLPGERHWRISATRAGRGDDHLVWRFEPEEVRDPQVELGIWIAGPFGDLLSAAGIEAALVGADGAIKACNRGFAQRAAGDPAATLAGQDFAALLRSDERERIFFARETGSGNPQTLVHVPLAEAEPVSDGAAGGFSPSLMLLLDAGVGIGGGWAGEPQGTTSQLQALVEHLPLGLAMTDRDGHLLFANPQFMRAAGIAGKSLPPYLSDLVVQQDKSALADAVRRFGSGPASSTDMAVRLRHDPDEPASLGLAGIRGLGEPAVLVSLADTTEEVRLKRQVAQQTKMQAVGQLAGGVAHDFNNVLTAIIGHCDLMLLRHTPGDSDYDDIQQVLANSNRAASLTRQLLAFSRQQTLQPVVLQLPDVVSEVSTMLKRLMGEKIEFKVHHDRNLGPVRADPQQLEQVIMNLALNARDAMLGRGSRTGEPGRLLMATRRVSSADIRRMGSEIMPVGDYTALIVEDTGGGIPPENLTKIFEPFFTTKELGKGTGLGLSTVYGIVKQSGGFIFADNVTSDRGVRGARFTIYLPVHHADPAVLEPVAPEAESSWSGGGHILLVEDEEMVRAVAERALTRQGYTVVTASDGEEGLEKIQSGEKFDLVLSDVVMPSMDGPAMARELRKLVPDLPVLFMSGYAEETLRNEIDIENMYFIAKPFSVQQIGDKVAGVLRAANK